MNVRRITMVTATATAALLMATGTASAAPTTETVYDTDLGIGKAWHTADTRPGGTLTWADTYGGALGKGAAVLSTPTGSAKVQLFTDAHDGTALSDITAVGYSTYQVAPVDGPQLPALNMRVDIDGDGDVDTYLVYEPYQDDEFYGNDAIENGEWQDWDAWHAGESQWWASHALAVPGCGQATPCTIDAILAAHPTAVIRSGGNELRSGSTPADADFDGSFGFNQGSGNTGVVGAADALHIATQATTERPATDVTYDFESTVTLAAKGDCKKGGWEASTNPVFRNQGDCVSHFAQK